MAGIKHISAIKTDVFERISSLLIFNKFENISDKSASADDIAKRTSVCVDILHKTDSVDKIKPASLILSSFTSRLIPSVQNKREKKSINSSEVYSWISLNEPVSNNGRQNSSPCVVILCKHWTVARFISKSGWIIKSS